MAGAVSMNEIGVGVGVGIDQWHIDSDVGHNKRDMFTIKGTCSQILHLHPIPLRVSHQRERSFL